MAEPLDFTNKDIEKLSIPVSGRDEYKDTKTQGLYLRVTPNGVKTFSFIGRARGSSRVERVTLGRFPTVKAKQARTRALQIAGELAGGKSVAASARQQRGELTLNELKAMYYEHLVDTTRRPDEFERTYRLYIEPHFGTRKLSEVRGPDVARWRRNLPRAIVAKRTKEAAERKAARENRRKEIELAQAKAGRRRGPDPKPKQEPLSAGRVTGKTAANRAVEALRALFNWAMKPQYRYFEGSVNPAAGLKRYAEVSRKRFLQGSELKPFFDALAKHPSEVPRDCILTYLLTGARRDNVEAMRWSEISFEEAEWRIPKTKNNEPHTVPLSEEALALLRQRKDNASSVFVFPSTESKTGHIVNTAKAWRSIITAAGLKDVRRHDLRRTLGSWQAKTGASLVIIGSTLAHKSQAATAVYAQLDLDPVRESVGRATTAMFVAAGLKEAPSNIVELPQRPKTQPERKRGKR